MPSSSSWLATCCPCSARSPDPQSVLMRFSSAQRTKISQVRKDGPVDLRRLGGDGGPAEVLLDPPPPGEAEGASSFRFGDELIDPFRQSVGQFLAAVSDRNEVTGLTVDHDLRNAAH